MQNEIKPDELINRFYSAFHACDHQTMNALYHPEVHFEDPAFGRLNAREVKYMWQMLCENQQGKDFKVQVSDIQVNGSQVSAQWQAWYAFSKTGRNVHNIIQARFEFQDGLIINHVDQFDLHRWAKQAMGFSGWLLGGTGFFRKKMQQQTRTMLNRYMEKQGAL